MFGGFFFFSPETFSKADYSIKQSFENLTNSGNSTQIDLQFCESEDMLSSSLLSQSFKFFELGLFDQRCERKYYMTYTTYC